MDGGELAECFRFSRRIVFATAHTQTCAAPSVFRVKALIKVLIWPRMIHSNFRRVDKGPKFENSPFAAHPIRRPHNASGREFLLSDPHRSVHSGGLDSRHCGMAPMKENT